MNSEDLYWSYNNYSLLVQFGVFANIWMLQVFGCV